MGKDQSVRLEVKERPDVGVYVKELSVFMVNNADDMDKLMTVGNRWGVTTTNFILEERGTFLRTFQKPQR